MECDKIHSRAHLPLPTAFPQRRAVAPGPCFAGSASEAHSKRIRPSPLYRDDRDDSTSPPTPSPFDLDPRAVKMKLNISHPANGSQKLIEIDDERKLRVFVDRRMGQEVPGDSIGDEFKGYVFRITGGNDKQGFPMKQGVMHPTRVRLLLSDGHSCYRPRRTGERKRKSVRGCIVAMDLSVLALSIVKQGEADIPGLTDTVHPKRLGPKRATKIRRMFGLSKEDDVGFLPLIVLRRVISIILR